MLPVAAVIAAIAAMSGQAQAQDVRPGAFHVSLECAPGVMTVQRAETAAVERVTLSAPPGSDCMSLAVVPRVDPATVAELEAARARIGEMERAAEAAAQPLRNVRTLLQAALQWLPEDILTGVDRRGENAPR